jgi:hypothetical protein
MMNRFTGNRGGVLKVLLIIFGVLFAIVLAVGIYVATHWKGWTADIANAAAQEIVRESGLPEDQKQSILSDIRKLGDDFKTGKVSMEQLGRVAKAITESPLIPLAGVQAVRTKYIEPSNMSAEEKAEANLTVQRYARGVHERKISTDDLERDAAPIARRKGPNNWELKENPTRAEIDQFLTNAKTKADAVNIPNEPFDLNIAEELKKAIRVD